MNGKMIKGIVTVVVVLLMTACAEYGVSHKYFMRGQVVNVSPSGAVVCIGTKYGAKKGQVLDAYRITAEVYEYEEGDDIYRQEYVGKVMVDKVIDEHFARVSFVSGNVEQYDMVELLSD